MAALANACAPPTFAFGTSVALLNMPKADGLIQNRAKSTEGVDPFLRGDTVRQLRGCIKEIFMQVQSKAGTSVGVQGKQPPVSLFKSSLRSWQARYKAG